MREKVFGYNRMGKKSKSFRKRQQRRERAKLRAEGVLPEESIEAQEQAADDAVEQSDKAVAEKTPSREKKAPKAAASTEISENPWDRLKRFFQEVIIESKKINWPSTDETWKSTMVTVVVILALSRFMGFCSAGLAEVSSTLFGINRPTAPRNLAGATPDHVGGTDTGAESGSEVTPETGGDPGTNGTE